jgi:hypothetical protein
MEKRETEPPNGNGRNEKPISIPLPFEDAIRAAVETPPPAEKPKRKRSQPRPRTGR